MYAYIYFNINFIDGSFDLCIKIKHTKLNDKESSQANSPLCLIYGRLYGVNISASAPLSHTWNVPYIDRTAKSYVIKGS